MAALESIFHNLDDVYDGGRNIKTILTSLLTLQLSDKIEEFSEISSLSFPIHKRYIIKSQSVSFSSRLWCHHKISHGNRFLCFCQRYGWEFLLFIPKLHETYHAMDQFLSSCAFIFWDHFSWWRLLRANVQCLGMDFRDRWENFCQIFSWNSQINSAANIIEGKSVAV